MKIQPVFEKNESGRFKPASWVSSLSISELVLILLDEPWHWRCEIIPDYMPPFPSQDRRPTVQVRYNSGTEYPPYLRYSKGPHQHFFWDCYGDDMMTVELAILALSRAPAPINVGPIEFNLSPKPDVQTEGNKENTGVVDRGTDSASLSTYDPSPADIYNACLSLRHDFGLLPSDQQALMRDEALAWLRVWGKALPQFKANT
jgi:hypothetical protein